MFRATSSVLAPRSDLVPSSMARSLEAIVVWPGAPHSVLAPSRAPKRNLRAHALSLFPQDSAGSNKLEITPKGFEQGHSFLSYTWNFVTAIIIAVFMKRRLFPFCGVLPY